MCRAFSCFLLKSGEVIWQTGIDSHDRLEPLLKKAGVKDDTTDGDLIKFARIEITPDEGYLFPEKGWALKVDENTIPRWLTKGKEGLCWQALEEWKKQVYPHINLKEARNPINPLKIKCHKVTSKDIENLKKWASVGDSVRDSVWDSVRASVWASVGDSVRDSVRDSVWDSVWDSARASVGDSVRDSVWASVGDSVWDSVGDSVWDSVRDSVGDSVWASVWAYVGSLFLNIKGWEEEYPYEPVVKLWKRGFIPSFDGKTWRLHSGEDGKIVYEISLKEDKDAES